MNEHHRQSLPAPLLAGALLLLSSAAGASPSLQGAVSLDYYVAGVDSEGFENTQSEISVERVANDGAAATGPLSLSGWLTAAPSPAGDGTEVGYVPIGFIPGSSSVDNVDEIVSANDAIPGEYYPHVLLQDDNVPGTYDDSRDLIPRVLWRGGLEATGPLRISPYADGSRVSVDFAQLRNNRTDNRYTNGIVLTLYATVGFGPASDGYTLCSTTVSGLYAGDRLDQPGFSCLLRAVPDGDYTVHLMVAEDGGRGGYSTLSGPDLRFFDGRVEGDYAYSDGAIYVAGATGPAMLAVLAGFLGLRWRRPRVAARIHPRFMRRGAH